jgi:hypothetical protein
MGLGQSGRRKGLRTGARLPVCQGPLRSAMHEHVRRCVTLKISLRKLLIRMTGIRYQQANHPERVISDTAILLHKRKERHAVAACKAMGCARECTPANAALERSLETNNR